MIINDSIKNNSLGIEIWRPVVGFETFYEVSNCGRVKSLGRIKIYKRIDQYSGRTLTVHRYHQGILLRPGKSSSRYWMVVLGRGNSKLIHTLVLEAFIGPCPPEYVCCHADDNPDNNHLRNLRWGTRSDNLYDAIKNGRKPVGEMHHLAKLHASDIPTIRARCAEGWGVVTAMARQYGVSEATIRQVRDGISWKSV